MNKLYFLGGVPRSGKSHIAEKFIEKKPMPSISLDAVTEGVRNIFNDDPFQVLKKIKIDGWIKYKVAETGERVTEQLDGLPLSEDTISFQALLGMIDHYRRNKSDLFIEGCIFDPDWVASHTFPDFEVHTVFVGYSDPKQLQEIVNHARNNEHDWVNGLLTKHKGDEEHVKNLFTQYVDKSQYLSESAKARGYRYFDITDQLFDDYVELVANYLATL
jgi:2-phosphoglycerate kinase